MSEVNKGGRPTKLDWDMLSAAREYLESCEDTTEIIGGKPQLKVRLPSIEGLAVRLRVARQTIYNWSNPPAEDEDIDDEQRELRAKFLDIIEELLATQAERLLNNGIAGTYNSTIAKVILSGKHGYIEKTRQDITTGDEPLNVALVKFIGDEGDDADAQQ